jgi:predicted deacylase
LSPWLEFLNVEGAVGQRSYEMARSSGFEDLIGLPPLPGRLLTAMGELGVPLIEGEVGGRGASRQEHVDFYKACVFAVARHLGVIAPELAVTAPEAARGSEASPGPTGRQPGIWHLGPNVTAQADGIWLRQMVLRQSVREGDHLGSIVDERGEVVSHVRAPADGLIGGYRDHAGVHTGERLATLWIHAEDLHIEREPPQPKEETSPP